MNRAKLEWTLIGLGVIFYLFVFPHGIHGDGAARWDTLRILLTEGRWYEQKYPMLGALFATPLYFLGYIVKDHFWWVSRFNSIVFLLSLIWFYRLLLPVVKDKDIARRYVLLLMGGAMFSKHITDFYAEVFTSCTIALGLLALANNKLKKGFLLTTFGVMNTPALIIGVTIAYIRRTLQARQFRFLLPIVFAILGVFLENTLRRGAPLNFGYGEQRQQPTILPSYNEYHGFNFDFGVGLLSIFFSFGKGLIFYIPGILLIPYMWKKIKGTTQTLLVDWSMVLLGMIILYSQFFAWHGSWYWGPRFFLFACFPAALALVHFLHISQKSIVQNLLLILILSLSIWASANGVTFGHDNMDYVLREMEPLSWYSIEFSALWRPFFVDDLKLKGRQIAFLVWHFLVWMNFMSLVLPDLGAQVKELWVRFKAHAADVEAWKF